MAFASRKGLAAGEVRKPLGWTVGLVVLLFLPFAAYYVWGYADWSWMYFFDPAGLPRGWWLTVFAAYLLLASAGVLLGAWVLRTWGSRASLLVQAATLLVLLVVSAVFWKRLWLVGTYAAYHAGAAHPLIEDPLLWAILLMGVVFLPGWGLAARSLERG